MNHTRSLNLGIKPSGGGWIREKRHSLGLTLSKLAEACNVSIATIAQAERGEAQGRITLETLRRAADAMNCELVYEFKPKIRHEDLH